MYYLCTKIYFVYKMQKKLFSKRDSSVKCSIELFAMFVHILKKVGVLLLPDIDMFGSMKNKEK